MSNIKIAFTKYFGQIIGEVTETLEDTVIIKNPCVVQISNQQWIKTFRIYKALL